MTIQGLTECLSGVSRVSRRSGGLEKVTGYWVSEFTIPGVAADSPHGWDLGLKWTASDEDKISSAGWATLANCLMVTADENLDLEQIKSLLQRVASDLSQAKIERVMP